MITVDDVNKSHLAERAHFTGHGFFGYVKQCVEHPRLQRVEKCVRKTRAVEVTWQVDGQNVASLEAAVEALNVPVVLTDDEAEALDLVPPTFAGLRAVEDKIAACPRPAGGIQPNTPHSRALDLIHRLQNKGVVELGKSPDRSDGKPWSDTLPAHLRFSPTVRRRPAPC